MRLNVSFFTEKKLKGAKKERNHSHDTNEIMDDSETEVMRERDLKLRGRPNDRSSYRPGDGNNSNAGSGISYQQRAILFVPASLIVIWRTSWLWPMPWPLQVPP
ncbi:hypothetical protein J437_LFUL004739 [Ladona fulva]|uniref:Uncharacterized protein n=1 Tax=Ladona fulva TaxID=123851 RepID=A0A8K0NYM9_LADFU|nr:hypothetical protein J437_LFUL004739 [Ladona fulva]